MTDNHSPTPPPNFQHYKHLKETVPDEKVHGDNVHERMFLDKLVLDFHSYLGSVMQSRMMHLINLEDDRLK